MFCLVGTNIEQGGRDTESKFMFSQKDARSRSCRAWLELVTLVKRENTEWRRDKCSRTENTEMCEAQNWWEGTDLGQVGHTVVQVCRESGEFGFVPYAAWYCTGFNHKTAVCKLG